MKPWWYIKRWIRWVFTGTVWCGGTKRIWKDCNGNWIGPRMTKEESESLA